MKLQKIYRQQWMEAHPRMQSADTDQWYVDFANRLLPVFEKSELTGQMIHKNRLRMNPTREFDKLLLDQS